jgi:hypothetical protein
LLNANFNLFNLSLSINFLSKEKLVAQPHLHLTFGDINKYLSFLECSELTSVFVNIFAHSKFFSSFFSKYTFFQSISIKESPSFSKSEVIFTFVQEHQAS